MPAAGRHFIAKLDKEARNINYIDWSVVRSSERFRHFVGR